MSSVMLRGFSGLNTRVVSLMPRRQLKQWRIPSNTDVEFETAATKRKFVEKEDPWGMKALPRNKTSSIERPNVVYGVAARRLLGCVCHEDATDVAWMWIQRGEPSQCACGHWFALKQSEIV